MKQYHFYWSNTHQLFYMFGNIDSYRKYRSIPFNRADVFQVSEGNLMSCYLSEQDLEKHVAEGVLFLKKEKTQRYIEEALKQCQNHRNFFETLKRADLASASDEELLQLWQDLVDNYAHSAAYFRSTQEEPSRKIVSTVTDVVTPEEVSDLLMSPELDVINKEEVDWEVLVESGFTKEKALKHLANHPWLFQNMMTYEETADELEQRLEGHVSRNIKAEKEELRKRQEVLLKKYPTLIGHVEILHQLALLRPRVKACWAATGYYANPLLQEIAQRKGVNFQALSLFYRSEDIETLLAEGRVLTEEEVLERKLCVAYELADGVFTSYVGEEALALKERLLGGEKQGETTELKGQGAHKGRVTGRVHILTVNDPDATRDFRQSFTSGILVTSMTQPNVVDIARRASAIVTDEGGMLCHAAIIAREFGIPCVVGTHTATQVLKDGDLVEVDADSGVVRVI